MLCTASGFGPKKTAVEVQGLYLDEGKPLRLSSKGKTADDVQKVRESVNGALPLEYTQLQLYSEQLLVNCGCKACTF